MKKQKVLFFISSIYGGGAERVMVDILCHIDRSFIEPVLVLLYSTEDSPYRQYLPEDIRVVITKRGSDSLAEKIKQFIAFVKIVRAERPNAILSMLTHNNIMAILAGIIFRIKVFACEHSTLGEVIKTENGKKMLGVHTSILVKTLYKFATKIIAVSEGINANLMEEFKIPAEKIEVIYNPLAMERIEKLKESPIEEKFIKRQIPVIIAMGRLEWVKGYDVLIKAFKKVVKEADARLIILGEGSEREALEALAADSGLTEKVTFPGFQNNPYPFFSNADIFVLSSRYEGLPMAVLEAMASGLPVIAADCKSGPREILQNGKCGLLVPAEDEAALAEGILELMKNRALREKFAISGSKRIMDFSADKIVKRYENLFLDPIRKK